MKSATRTTGFVESGCWHLKGALLPDGLGNGFDFRQAGPSWCLWRDNFSSPFLAIYLTACKSRSLKFSPGTFVATETEAQTARLSPHWSSGLPAWASPTSCRFSGLPVRGMGTDGTVLASHSLLGQGQGASSTGPRALVVVEERPAGHSGFVITIRDF